MGMLRFFGVMLFFCGYISAADLGYRFSKERENKYEYIVIIEPITEKIKAKIAGKSWLPECPVPLEDLRYLSIPHWDLQGKISLGELIVHKDVAKELAEIFKEMYEGSFPIEKMHLVDYYFHPGIDREEVVDYSCVDNNTSAFFYRKIGKTGIVSEHGLGTAIDINPLVNPLVQGNEVWPCCAKEYADRTRSGVPGYITEKSICYLAFMKQGWKWGGNWKNVKDYQHFCKQEIIPKSFNS